MVLNWHERGNNNLGVNLEVKRARQGKRVLNYWGVELLPCRTSLWLATRGMSVNAHIADTQKSIMSAFYILLQHRQLLVRVDIVL